MSVKTYPVALPKSAFSALRKTPAEFVVEMKWVCFICLNYRQAETEPVEVVAVAAAFDRLRRRLVFK